MLKLFVVLILLGVAAGIVALFVRWEKEGREHLVPLLLLGLLIVEATIYADQVTLPRSLFHPGSGSAQLRLPEIYITLALLARLIARGKPTRIGLPAGLWLAFAAWMFVGAIEGGLYHNRLTQNLYEAKDILYITGAYALAAGVPVRRYIDSGGLLRLGNLTVACVTVLDLMTIAHISFSTHIPGLPLQGFGAVGSETAAIALAIGTICFFVRLASGPVRTRHVLAFVPIVTAIVLSNQRAVLVNLAVVVVVLLVLLFAGPWRGAVRRFSVRAGQIVLVALAVVGVALAVLFVPAAVDQQPVHIPLSSQFDRLFHSQGKIESAQDRLNLAASAEKLIPQHLFIGWGLGMEFQYYEAGVRKVIPIAYAHNIVLDLWLRLGLIGLIMFVAAMAFSLVDGVNAWRRHPDPIVAALALSIVAVLAGLLATAFLEPFLDEYRLATLFGVSLGMLRAAVTSMAYTVPHPAGQHEMGRTAWT
jgi:O-antigen ligase